MSKVSHEYAAGLIDGEGSILLTKRNRSRWRVPAVSITSTTIDFLEAMKETYGGFIVTHTKKTERWSQAWSWKIEGDAALAMLREVSPFMLEQKKRIRAKHLLTWYKNLTPRNGKYTDYMIELKTEFEDAFFKF